MSFTTHAIFSFGASQTGLADLRAQPCTISGATTGSVITTGFTEKGRGIYAWTGSVPDGSYSIHAYRLVDATVMDVVDIANESNIVRVLGTAATTVTPQSINVDNDGNVQAVNSNGDVISSVESITALDAKIGTPQVTIADDIVASGGGGSPITVEMSEIIGQ